MAVVLTAVAIVGGASTATAASSQPVCTQGGGWSEFAINTPGGVPAISVAATSGDTSFAQDVATAAGADVEVSGKLIVNGVDVGAKLAALQAGSAYSTYVRWGRTACPAGATRLYQGATMSGWYTLAGVGHYTCMPYNDAAVPVQYDPLSSATAGGSKFQYYPTEFETNGRLNLNNNNNREATCALCEVTSSEVRVFPARTSCPTGWTLQYFGWMMSQIHNSGYPRVAICMDFQPDIFGDASDNNGGLLYFQYVQCASPDPSIGCVAGGLTVGRELSCAVCSK